MPTYNFNTTGKPTATSPATTTVVTTTTSTTTSPAPLTPNFASTSLNIDQTRDYTGTVVFFHEYKEYGFIIPDDGQGLPATWNGGLEPGSHYDHENANNNVFFHVSNIQRKGRRYLDKGDHVQFYLRLDEKSGRVKAEEIYLIYKSNKGEWVIDEKRALWPDERITKIHRVARSHAFFIKVVDKGIDLEEVGENPKTGETLYSEVISKYFDPKSIVGAFSGIRDEHDKEDFFPFTIAELMPGVEIEVIACSQWGEIGWHYNKDKQQQPQPSEAARHGEQFPSNQLRTELLEKVLKSKKNELPSYMLRKKRGTVRPTGDDSDAPVETATTFEEAVAGVKPLAKETETEELG